MASQNYRVEILLYRHYPKGSVIPDYEANANGNLKEALADGHLSPTNDAVNVELVAPVLEDRTADDLHAKVRELTTELEQTKTAAKSFGAAAESAQSKASALSTALAEKIAEIQRLKDLLDERDAALAKAQAELEAAQELLEPAK